MKYNLRNRETVNLESCGGEGKANFYRDYSKNNKNCEIPAEKDLLTQKNFGIK